MRCALKYALTVLICLLPATAQAKLFNAESFTLENGLQVVVIPNHRAPVVTHMMWYKFGGADEQPGKSGIAHFLEHLMFKGTDKVASGDFSTIVKKLGGNDNAFTSQDYTAYYQSIAKEHLATVMEMEADRMRGLTLAQDEVLAERQVIVEERRQRVDNQPQARFREQLMSALFVNHPYSTPVIGWMSEIQKLTRDDAFTYYRQWYTPNNALLIIAGDMTAAEFKPLAQKYYGSLQSQPVPERVRPRPAPIIAAQRLTLKDPRVGSPVIMQMHRTARGNDALALLENILGGTSTSRLYKNLVIDQKKAIEAGASYNPTSLNQTTFSLYASPTPDTPLADLEAALQQEIAQVIDQGITQEELDTARKRVAASRVYHLDSLQGPALLFGRALASGFDIDYIENMDTRLAKITVEDINRAARDLFQADDLPITGIMLPEIKEPAETVKGKK